MRGSSRSRARLRRGRFAVAGALAASAVMAFGVSSAQATSRAFNAQYDNAYLNIGPAFDILTPTAPPVGDATMTGTVDDVTGAFTVPQVNFVFPPFSGPVLGGAATVAVDLTAQAPITGTVNPATGAVDTTASAYRALVDVTIGTTTNHCRIDANFDFHTNADYPAPYKGDAFDAPINLASPTPSELNHGAIVATWPSLTATPVGPSDDCSLLQGLVNGRGGLWIANGIETPTPTTAPSTGGGGTTPTTPAPKKKKCKKAKKHSASASKKSKCKKKKK
jgi:hypothetical protein